MSWTSFGRVNRAAAFLSMLTRLRRSSNTSNHATQPRVKSRLPMRRSAISFVCSTLFSCSAASLSCISFARETSWPLAIASCRFVSLSSCVSWST